MNSNFNSNRFFHLIKNDFTLYKKNIFLFFIFSIFINILCSLFLPHSSGYYGTVYAAYLFPVLMLMIILTGFSFIEFDSDKRKIFFLMQPSYLLEKYLSRFITTLFLYFIMGLLIYFISQYFVSILNASNEYFHQSKFFLFRGVDNPDLYLKVFLMFHSIFFFGAVFFNKNSFLKTAITCGLIFVIFLAWMKLMHMIFIPEANVSFLMSIDNSLFYSSEKAFKKFAEYKSSFSALISVILFYIIPPIMWVLTYFRLKEEEAANGIQ